MIDFSKITMPPKLLYYLGSYVLLIMVIGGIIALIFNWTAFNIGNILFSIGGIAFNILFVIFFISLYLQECKKPEMVVNNPELEQMLKELNEKQEVKQNGKNNNSKGS